MKIKIQLLLSLSLVISLMGNCQTWSSIGSGAVGIATTSSIVAFSDRLYFGAWYGTAYFAGTPVKGLCRFNGLEFDTLNQGLFGGVYDVAWYDSKLVAAGQSFCAGAPPNCIASTENVAAWDSVNGWYSITPNGGADNPVNCLETYNNELYAGGSFVTINNLSVNRIAKWNGSTWSDVGGGVTGGMGVINCMAVYHNQLYIGGFFSLAGSNNVPVNCIARWNGASWDSVSSGMNYPVHALLVDSVNDVLIAAGEFSYVGNTICRGIAAWNDSVWRPVGTGLDTLWGTRCLAIYNGELYAGGGNVTTTNQGDTINNVYKFDGTTWISVDGGANNTVLDMAVYNGNLYIGGYFTQVGYGIQASKIACYGSTCPTSVGISEHVATLPFSVYPNPSRGFINVTTGENRELLFEIYNGTGVLIDQRRFYQKLQYSTAGLPIGIYLISISDASGSNVRKSIVILD